MAMRVGRIERDLDELLEQLESEPKHEREPSSR
jgi:hypothetical protein